MKYLLLLILLFVYVPVKNLTHSLVFVHTNELNNIKSKADEAFLYCNQHQFNTDFCLLMDAGIHSGKKRIVVWDFETDSIRYAGLCSHGCCANPWGQDFTKDNPKFSNDNGSHCSSLGKYKIGARGYSSWGIHVNYKLHGLEATNSNAYIREIVLHSWDMIPEGEIYPNGVPEGWGCPAVSDGFLSKVDKLLQVPAKPVLFWIFK